MRYFIYILLVSGIFSQSWYNHPELIWKTYETEHFIFHYHEGTENTVTEAAIVAENIYKPIILISSIGYSVYYYNYIQYIKNTNNYNYYYF